MRFPEVVGTYEIAELLGISRQRVQQLANTEGFPAPVAKLRVGHIWLRADIERWARERGRL